jgi:nucleotide-binding universal stress UspA family protein
VIGDDGSPESRRAAELAAMIGGICAAEALLVRAIPTLPPPGEGDDRAERAARFQAEALRHAEGELTCLGDTLTPLLGRRPAVYSTVEDAAITLVRLADEGNTPALIAVGTRGTAPAGQLWLGSTALEVLTCATGSVLVCPHRAVTDDRLGE